MCHRIEKGFPTDENDSDEILTDRRLQSRQGPIPQGCESARNHCCLLRGLFVRYQPMC
jgi:hypothetical protein